MTGALSLTLSPLSHTWLIDIDGCVFAHNGHLRGVDILLPGVAEFWATIPSGDRIILLTSRTAQHAEHTQQALHVHGLRYDQIIFDLPYGERILLNDKKPSGLPTAHAINLTRDSGLTQVSVKTDQTL